jgi:hypothetical protein
MTSTTDPQLVTTAEAARLLGVTRQRVLELAAVAADFPPGQPTPTGGGHPPQIWAVMNRAAHEAQELNHPWIGDDHLMLGMLHPDCPGAYQPQPLPHRLGRPLWGHR